MMRSLVLALFIFGTIPFIFTRPFIGLLVWSWLGYMNPYRLTYGFAYSFPWVMIIAVITLGSLAVSKESKRIPLTAVSVLLFLFVAWTGFTTIFAVEPVDAWRKFQQFAKIMVMVFVTLMLVHDRKRMDWLVWMIVVSLGFYGVKGGAFTAATGGHYHVLGPAASFIAGNNDLAQGLCMILPLMRYLQLQASRKWVRVGLGLAMLLTAIAVFGTYSRGGLIALFAVVIALLMKSRKRFALVAVVAVLGMTAYHFMPPQWMARMQTLHHAEQVNTAQTRIQSWEFATNVALHRPVVGGGFDVYKSKYMWDHYGPEGAKLRAIHSIYFHVLGDQGFLGLAMFLGLLFVSWRSCTYVRKRARAQPADRWMYDLASMLQVSLLAFLVAGAATTSSYFDLTYQLMAMCTLLKLIWLGKQAASAPNKSASPALTQSAASARGVALPRRNAAKGQHG